MVTDNRAYVNTAAVALIFDVPVCPELSHLVADTTILCFLWSYSDVEYCNLQVPVVMCLMLPWLCRIIRDYKGRDNRRYPSMSS